VAESRRGVRDRVAGRDGGADVAFAFALLRCGTPEQFERNPEQRLRLTIGLRKAGGRWTVTHEHHSFADASESS
jgi:ketosteroid isomerase-like protein